MTPGQENVLIDKLTTIDDNIDRLIDLISTLWLYSNQTKVITESLGDGFTVEDRK
jgi:hypothetical protein